MRFFALIATTCFVATFLAAKASAQAPPPGGVPPPVAGGVPPPVPPPMGGIPPVGIPPMGMGMGLPPVFPGVYPGLLGMNGLLGFPFLGGLGGLGLLGGLGGFGLGGGLLGRGLLGRGIRGRRDVNETEVNDTIRCVLALHSNILNCTGPHEIIECKIRPRNVVEPSTKSAIFGLTFKEHKKHQLFKPATDVLRLVAPNSSGKFTFVDPASHSKVLLCIYADKKCQEPGFLVEEKECFDEIRSLFKANQGNTEVVLKSNF